jgi:hypothetical protein
MSNIKEALIIDCKINSNHAQLHVMNKIYSKLKEVTMNMKQTQSMCGIHIKQLKVYTVIRRCQQYNKLVREYIILCSPIAIG